MWAGSQRPTPKPMGHFDTLDTVLQVVILTTWKCEIKGSFWTFDFRMDTACPPYFDKLKLTVLTVQICSRPQKQIYGLDRVKAAFFRFWHLKTYPTSKMHFVFENSHFSTLLTDPF